MVTASVRDAGFVNRYLLGWISCGVVSLHRWNFDFRATFVWSRGVDEKSRRSNIYNTQGHNTYRGREKRKDTTVSHTLGAKAYMSCVHGWGCVCMCRWYSVYLSLFLSLCVSMCGCVCHSWGGGKRSPKTETERDKKERKKRNEKESYLELSH